MGDVTMDMLREVLNGIDAFMAQATPQSPNTVPQKVARGGQ